jgi:4-hydroxy-tetrahydrodipicolinate reductase
MNTPKIKVIVNGAFGKMGLLACEALQSDARFELIAQLGRQDNLEAELRYHSADLILDLTQADCVWDNCQNYLKYPIRFVIGTSGLEPIQISTLADICKQKKQGAAIIPNFSIGAVLNIHFAKLAAKWFDAVDIIEMHHHHKIDSPSGTAIHTAHEILKAKSDWPEMNLTPQAGRQSFIENKIPIHSVRMQGLLAVQQVLFGQTGETINLSHQIIDRKAYMPGILLSCEQVMQQDDLVVGLDKWLIL